MKYKLVDILPPYKPGMCRGCVFYTSGDCKRLSTLSSCISHVNSDYHKPIYKHYHLVCDSLNKQTKVL